MKSHLMSAAFALLLAAGCAVGGRPESAAAPLNRAELAAQVRATTDAGYTVLVFRRPGESPGGAAAGGGPGRRGGF